MKKLELNQMEIVEAGGNGRQCLIDGVATLAGIALGGITGGPYGMAGALLVGIGAANSNGCFN